MEIRQLTEDEHPQFMRLMADAYPGEGVVTPEDHEKQCQRLKKRLQDKRVSIWGAFRDGNMVGTMRFHDFNMNVRGKMMTVGGLGGVAVHLAHKKERIAKEMVEFYLDYYNGRGISMTTLWPFRADFYHKMGFGLGGRMYEYRIKPDSFRAGKTKENVRFLSPEDAPQINECYNRFVQTRTGLVEEVEEYWSLSFEYNHANKFFGCEIDGRLEGFVSGAFEPEVVGNLLDNNLKINRLVWNSPEALSQLLTFLHSQADQINRIIVTTGEDEFYYLLKDPYNGSRHEFFPINQESHVAGVGIMYRIMDIPRFFGELDSIQFSDVATTIKLNLTDSFFKTGEQPYYLKAFGGRIVCDNNGAADAEISMDIAEFSSMLMGGIGFEMLCGYGLARISDKALTATVDRMFGGIKPSYTQAIF